MNIVSPGKENSCLPKSPKSPCVLKPKPLCFRRKQKQVNLVRPLGPLDTNVSSVGNAPLGFLTQPLATSINPFKIIRKRSRSIDEKEIEDESLLSRSINSKVPRTDNRFNPTPSLVDENAHFGLGNHFSLNCNSSQLMPLDRQRTFPVDWSLKTKIRLTSSKPFPWRSSFKTSEEASGTTAFVRCLHSEDKKNVHLDSSHGAKFYQQCLVWMHPSLPWLNLFPRTDSVTVSASPLPPLDTKFVDVLRSNWCDSFRSLYQLVRTCQCPYFYLCAPTFTVIFRSGGVGSVIDIHAAITPTTRGLRNALTEEGIEFTMPLNTDSHNSPVSDDNLAFAKTGSASAANTEDASSEDDEPGAWLESLGLSQQDFPSLNPRAVKRQEERRKSVDHRHESLVYVEGADTQALVNFLLNYPSCTSKVGQMAGIPPTLLSPVAFFGATLQSHKVRHAKIRDKTDEIYVVELNGALLPNIIHSLCSLLNITQDGSFSATLTPHQPTLAFAKLPQSSGLPSAFATENLKDCGLPSPFIQQMCSKTNQQDMKGISTISSENGLFAWS